MLVPPVERVADEAPLTVMLMARGSAWITPDGDDVPVRLGPGDLAITRGPDRYTSGGECRYPDGTSLNGSMDLGVRTWGDRPDAGTIMLIGTCLMRGEISGRPLDALPPLPTFPADVWACPITPLPAEESVRDEPGQDVVLDRLLDLLLISALRAWSPARRRRPPPGTRRRSGGPSTPSPARSATAAPSPPPLSTR